MDAFLKGRLSFVDIVPTVERTVADHGASAGPGQEPMTVEMVLDADVWARRHTRAILV